MNHLKFLPYRKSLVFRATIWLAASSTLMVIFLALFNTRFIQSEYTHMEEQKISTIMDDALKLLGINLSYGFENAINETGRALVANTNILSVRIVDKVTGREYEFSSPLPDGIKAEYEKTVAVTDPASGAEIGELTVNYFREGYRKMMIRYYTNLAAVVFLYLVSIALLVRFLFKRLSPLRQLADSMLSFSPKEGRFKLRLTKNRGSDDEISVITSAAQAMVRDIEDHALRLEELNRQLQKSRDELEQRVRERTRELEEKQMQLAHAGRLAALGELAAGVAHELGQPLQIIKSASIIISEEIRDGSFVDAEIIPIAQKITAQVDRAFSIISTMRRFARFQGSKEPLCVTDVSDALEEALSFFRSQFRQHGIRLDLTIPQRLSLAQIEPQKFQQIAVNLLSNARYAVEKKAANQKPTFEKRIAISLAEVASEVVLEVKDNGIGMDHEERERCLEPFYTTKEPDQGTGLGLSIVYGIVREFGARVEIESERGSGTIFRVYLKAALSNKDRSYG